MTRPYPKEESIFLAARDHRDPAERAAYLSSACNDAQLRQRVERLLALDEADNGPLDERLVRVEALPDLPLVEQAGAQIGPYKLLEQIGEGGFGVVFLAEQERPVKRRVALKVIKPGMDTRQVIARFEAERQALALMDHPNIAKVFDAGATENGRPYFVMELVGGVPITEYCDQCNQSTRERLELFVLVCQAVQHAHQKGIIHRDLKPTNVLVAMQDSQPVPKIIDFGVAKATGQRLTEHTLATGFAQMIGTPLYMSPEQAELSPLGVDTRSDIYSLGVLLYELLTGSTPFDKDRLHAASYDELRRIIREEEPPRPSARISTLEAAVISTIAEHRHTDARRLRQTVRGELDWIVMKCLEKDRNRRYESASTLARDIERYLNDETVQACPPSLAYNIRKYVKRNKRGVVMATVFAVAMVAGIAGTAGSVGWAIRDKEAREAAFESRITALLESAEYELDQGRLVYALRAIERAASVMDSSEPHLTLQNRLHDLARRWGRMKMESDVAEDLIRMGLFYESDAHFVTAEAKFRKAVADLPENSVTHAFLARNLAKQGKLTEAERFAREAVRLDSDEAWAHYCLAYVLMRQEKFPEAVEQYRADLRHQKEWGNYRNLDNYKFDEQVYHARLEQQSVSDRGRCHIELAWALERAEKTADAKVEFQKARDNGFASPTFAGNYFADQGRLFEAAAHYLEATRANPDDSETALRAACLQLAIGDREQYETLCKQMLDRFGQADDSEVASRVCFACLLSPQPVGDLDELRRLSKVGDGVPPHLVNRARALVAYRAGNWEEALQSCRDSRRHATVNSLSKVYDLQNLVVEAIVLHHMGRSDEASNAYEESTNIAREIFPRAPTYLHKSTMLDLWTEWVLYEPLRREAEALVPQSTALLLLGLANGSADGVRRAVSQARALSWDKLDSRDLLVCGELLILGGDFERAAAAISQAITRGGKGPSYYKPLGWALLRAGKKDEAAAALSTALEGLDRDQLVAKGEPEQWTAAFLLGRVSESDYIDHWQQHPKFWSRFRAMPWFYIGQKAEADGNLQRALNAYRSSVEMGASTDNWWQGKWSGMADELVMAGAGFISDISGTWAAYRLTELPAGPKPAPKQPEPEEILAAMKRYDEESDRYKARREYFTFDDVLGYNSQAWRLVTAPASEARKPARAVELATRAVELAPAYGGAWNTLGVAEYRAGNWNASIEAFLKSMDLRDGGDAFDWFFLAAAHWELGHIDEARRWFDEAVDWMEKNQPDNEELRRFRAEAANVLRIPQPQSKLD